MDRGYRTDIRFRCVSQIIPFRTYLFSFSLFLLFVYVFYLSLRELLTRLHNQQEGSRGNRIAVDRDNATLHDSLSLSLSLSLESGSAVQQYNSFSVVAHGGQ